MSEYVLTVNHADGKRFVAYVGGVMSLVVDRADATRWKFRDGAECVADAANQWSPVQLNVERLKP